ncbi:MAG TPA: hypothetical protein VIY90_01910 [Steroidobacteraceae bacterium]
MIIRYDVTVADMVNVMRRAARRREPRLDWRWQQSILASALLTVFFFGGIEGPFAAKTFGSVGFFVAAFAAVTHSQRRRVAAAFKRYVESQYGLSAPFTFEIEITSAGMIARQLGQRAKRGWSVERRGFGAICRAGQGR